MQPVYDLLTDQTIKSRFQELCKTLDIENIDDELLRTVIYEMTDGMRTSTAQKGQDAYFDGGIFCLRVIHMLRVLGMPACYINVIEEKHKNRENYPDIFVGLKNLFPIYEEYAQKYNVKLCFLGDLGESLEPSGHAGNFALQLQELMRKTEKNTSFCAIFLINYSLDWAIKHPEIFRELPNIDVTVRHTKFQFPTGMMLPPYRSDFSSLMYVQQGSAGSTWSDQQLLTLIALSVRSKVLNSGTQYLKRYGAGEKELIRKQREEDLYFVHRQLFSEKSPQPSKYPPNSKRAVIAGSSGPETYEF
ncbi:MAG: hypothetical protein NWE93_05130 [Candidatus Bathyarchaeota archaeon]|nr:hypothetical protein [Candidatus Bathyarchaeota archaeon]